MIINNNMQAMNTHRQLGLTTLAGSKSMEKLSSGFRINRAGDDAAGLSISEKMRAQIRGLGQASRNAQDSISLIQTAEGALTESHAILQRMRVLAVQSANDTNVLEDRAAIQAEIDELTEELTRIADTTEFNTQNLLIGEFRGVFHIGANANQDISLTIGDMRAAALGVEGLTSAEFTVEGTVANSTDSNSVLYSDGGTFNVVAMEDYDGTTITLADTESTDLDDISYVLVDDDGNAVATSEDGLLYSEVNGTAASRGSITFTTEITSGEVVVDTSGATPTATGTLTIEEPVLEKGTYTVTDISADSDYNFGLVDSAGNIVAYGTDAAGDSETIANITQWVSADDTSVVVLDTDALAADTVVTVAGGGVDVSTQEAASAAITTINSALEIVSEQRSRLGAAQNRLEHTIKNLEASAENLQASESRIRDVDMAQEIMEFTKQNILQQAATAMLAQANQAPQGVLQLLR